MSSRGRPRSFDREAALEKVMQVFWAKGYECAQINDFTSAIGITPPSFYAAFENKERAFQEAVKHYQQTVAAEPFDELEAAGNIRDGLRRWLELSADLAFENPAGGCMISVSSIQCKPENGNVKAFLQAVRRDNIERLRARFLKALQSGDLQPDTDTSQLTEFYSAIQQSLSYEARDGSTREAAQKIVEMAMRALP